MKRSGQALISAIVLVTLLLVATFAFITYSNNKRTNVSNRLVVHTNQVLYKSERIISELKDAETGTRGFVISGDSSFLQPYMDSRDVIAGNIASLKTFTQDNPEQQLRIDTLAKLAQARLTACTTVQSFRRSNGYSTTAIIPLLQKGKDIMDQIRSVTARLQQSENKLLAQRELDNYNNIHTAEKNFYFFIASLAVLILTTFIAVKYLGRLRRTQGNALSQLDTKLVFFSKRLDDVIKGIADPFFALDKKEHFIFFNEAVQNRMALGKGKLIGNHFFTIFPQYEHNTLGQKIKAVLQTGKPESFETYDDFLDQWQDVTVYPTAEGVSVYIKDASKRKASEEELNATKKLLQETSEVALIGGWEVDLQANKVIWTPVTSMIHETAPGFKPDLKNGIQFYKEGDSRNTIIRLVNEAMEHGSGWDAELQIITAAGREKWVRTKGKAIKEDGHYVKLLGTFQDIDEQKKAADKLKEEKRLLKTIIDNIPVNVYMKDTQSRKILVNRQEMEYAGAGNENEILGKSDLDLYPADHAAISIAEDKKVITTKEPLLHQETTSLRNDGTLTKFLTSKIPFVNEQGEVTGLIGISYNVGEIKQ